MSRNQRRNFDVDYSEGGAIVPANRLQNMLQQVQQQGGIVNQQPNVSPMTTYETQPVGVMLWHWYKSFSFHRRLLYPLLHLA